MIRRGVPRLLRSVDRFFDTWGPAPRRFSAAELVERAVRRTGFSDFGDGSFEEPLGVLARSYEEEANLSAFGRIAARWDALRFLSNLLLLHRAEQQTPEILDETIARPIFITGLPRSGTTFLHHLLARDPSNLVVRCWETIYPCTTDATWPSAPGPSADRVDRRLNAFARLAPEVPRVHPMSARSPQECTEITAHVFRSLRFDTTHHVPTYRLWLDEVGHLDAFRFHRRFLKYLQHHKGPGRWVLKCPDHVFALDEIREVYPDARFIFVHRSPLEVLPSVAELTEVLRRPFTRSVDRMAIGKQVSERWARGAEILVATADRFGDSPDVAHLLFRELVQNPLRTVSALYARFGLTLSDGFATEIGTFAAEWPNGGDRQKCSLEEFGLREDEERSRYRAYMTRFGF
ncbi:MAG TPA: sulfotransferase [Stellaceae bacterium]|nr:sulfotransferase [Stellaceae bacterium]